MGCDIHLHTEVKLKGKWNHYSAPNVDRYYGLFAKMANVRNYSSQIKPISNPKGLPTDASEVTLLDSNLYGSDGHSHSWLNPQEIEHLYAWLKQFVDKEELPWDMLRNNFGYVFGEHWGDFIQYRESFPEQVEDIRFVFFFDN